MHNDFVRPSGRWHGVSVPTVRDARELDDRAAKSLNGWYGGSWAPKTPIVIGGAGVLTTAPGSRIEGGVLTRVGGRVVCGADDVPVFSVARARTVVVPLFGPRVARASAWTWTPQASPAGWRVVSAAASVAVTVRFALPLMELHSSATLSQARLVMRVGGRPVALPSVALPRFRLQRISANHATVQALLSTGSGWATLPTPGSPDAYFDQGKPHTIVMNCNQNNVVDRQTYTYVLEVQDAVGGLAGNTFHALELSFTNIADARFA